MLQLLDSLEHSVLSMWIKESTSLWPYDIFCLSAHAVGMALLVGFSSAIALRVIGYAPGIPLAPMAKFFPVIYAGFWINALSGTGLFITYPVKAVTNPIFYVKMAGVVAAIVCVRVIGQHLFAAPGRFDEPVRLARAKRPAMTLLIVWVVTITAGRLLAYKGIPAIEIMTVVGMAGISAVAAGVWYFAARLRASQSRVADRVGSY
jgi:hypothetical protein